MFSSVLSNLTRYLWKGDEHFRQDGSMMQLPSGEFYGYRRQLAGKNMTPLKECIFKDATLTICRVSKHLYSLVVFRVFEEGEENLLTLNQGNTYDDEDNGIFILRELHFDIQLSMSFERRTSIQGGISFKWSLRPKLPADLQTGFAAREFSKWIAPYTMDFEYTPDKAVTAHTLQLFHITLAQCIYETSTGDDFTKASPDDLEAIMGNSWTYNVSKISSEEKKDILPVMIVLFSVSDIPFYVYDTSSNHFVTRNENAVASIGYSAADPFLYFLTIKTANEEVLYHQLICPSSTQHLDRPSKSFIWCHSSADEVWTFSLRFDNETDLFGWTNAYARAVFEILNKAPIKDLAESDREFLFRPFLQDVEMKMEAENEKSDVEDDQEDEVNEVISDDEIHTQPSSSERNKILSVGSKTDRAFVSRGSSIGVFKQSADGKLSFQTTIKKVNTTSGDKSAFTPTKMQLHEGDRSLLLLHPTKRDRVFRMDLEAGRVVDEWNLTSPENEGALNLSSIVPNAKYAPSTDASTLIGLTGNALFRIDPRLSGSKRVESGGKIYATKTDFTVGATTGKGELAVASAKGEIRLFDKLDKRAKTLLPGFGDPILGIDVAESGHWILATCKTYLLLIDSSIGDDYTGFTKSMGANKPTPRRLQLKPEHVAYMGRGVSFTEAHFSTGTREEKSIIASTGPYIITWSLTDILKGKIFDYAIKKYSDTVVADNFSFGQDRRIIVTLPNQVTMASKNQMVTPSKSKKSFSDIVDSPF